MVHNSTHSKISGFTLIELMIVIAIVGVLSAIVLNFFRSSRYKANDAKVKSHLASARLQAYIFYDANNNSYNGTTGNVANNCNANNSMFRDNGNLSKIRQYTDENVNYPSVTTLRCSSTATAYQITASLEQNLGDTSSLRLDYWCINSAGFSGIIEARNHARAHPNNDLDCVPNNP